MTNQIKKELSIQVNLNGLSFCISNSVSKEITYNNSLTFEEKKTPFETLKRLKEELSSNTVFSENFTTVKVVHCNELSTLVPEPLYDEAYNAEYLKFNSKILKTDFIASEKLETQSAVSVYVPYVNINNYIFDTFGAFSYKHASTVFIDAISKIETSETTVFINIVSNAMQIAIFNNKTLDFYNYFEFLSPEDFIYYLLFTCEQKQLNTDTLQLKFTGAIVESNDIYNIAYKYIRNVEIVSDSQNYLIKNSF